MWSFAVGGGASAWGCGSMTSMPGCQGKTGCNAPIYAFGFDGCSTDGHIRMPLGFPMCARPYLSMSLCRAGRGVSARVATGQA